MTRRFWVNFFVVLGLIALSVLVWFVGPMIGFGESWPLEGIFTRIIVISVFWLIAIIVWLIKWLRRRKQARALEEEVAGPENDTPILREKLQDAMATLKKSSKRGGTAYLYDLPWYIIIGPPGSGKTTALVNSGLKFPLADKAGGAQAIAGTGGTRHCDWWFTEDAVMIDTAGRYTTQDSDADADSTSWGGFLDMLADNRPRQPINGVLICISIEDLMTVSPGELDAHANAIRRRLDELQNRLKIGFPVYVMFTKMDLVAGFMDFYGDLTPDQRAIVWGTTFKPKNKTDNMVTSFPEEFDELMLALSEQTTDRLQMEPDAQARTRVFGFPSQVASLKDPINNFLTRIFETTRYQADAALRGVYFTSGTQEGTPIDRVLGVLGRNFGAQGGMAIPFSGQGRSFFLTDLLQKVVFAESGWVSTNMAHLRRAFAIKTVMYVCLAAATIGVGGLWGYSYMQNKELVEQVEEGIVDYREMAAVQLAEAKIGDGDLGAVLAPLDKLRNMPQGYASRDDDIPLTQTFGLSQHEDLRRANIASYRDALDRLFTPRLIWRLESRLSNDINNIEFVYEALKVYLMMGGQARMDEDLIRTWMAREWSKQYPGAGNAKGRERLMAHLDAVLERPSSTVPLSGPLIQEAQRTLARMPVADRAYRLMMTLAASKEYEPWIASERGGPDAEVVFETRDGAPLSEVEIHGFFTYEGFHLGVLEEMENIIERAREENWVMGEVGEQADITGQFKTIRRDIMNLYRADFIANWDQQLSRLQIASVGGGGDLTVINALAAPTSPLRQIMRSIRSETALTQGVEESAEGGTGAAGAAADRAARIETERAMRAQARSAAGRIATEAALGAMDSQSLPGDESGPAINYGERIEAHFKQLHEFAGTADGPAPVDNLVNQFNQLYQAMNLMKAGGSAKIQAVQQMDATLQQMKAEAPRLPGIVADMTQNTRATLQSVATGSSVAQINQSLGDEVSRQCQNILRGVYPFAPNAVKDIGMDDFARLFGPTGIMKSFFDQKLAGMVDRSGANWRWRGDTAVSRNLSNQSLRQFQRAYQIHDAFFATGAPRVNFTVNAITLSPQAETVTLDIDGQQLKYAHGPARPMNMMWPGPASGRTEVAVTPELPGELNRISKNGTWGLFRLLRQSSALTEGSLMSVTFKIGRHDALFEFRSQSSLNPFTLSAIRDFRCPTGL